MELFPELSTVECVSAPLAAAQKRVRTPQQWAAEVSTEVAMLRIVRPCKMTLHGCVQFDVDEKRAEFLRRVGHARIPFWCDSARVLHHLRLLGASVHLDCAPEVKRCVLTFVIAMSRSRPLIDPASKKAQAVLPRLPPELLKLIMWFFDCRIRRCCRRPPSAGRAPARAPAAVVTAARFAKTSRPPQPFRC